MQTTKILTFQQMKSMRGKNQHVGLTAIIVIHFSATRMNSPKNQKVSEENQMFSWA
jgi:hypothetical protein